MITCENCPDSSCCRDVTTEIDDPETLEDWDEIRWMVSHKNVAVYKDNDDDWVVEFKTPCEKLNEKGGCTVYHKRPGICQEHALDTCVYNGEGDTYKVRFDTVEQVEDYIKKNALAKMKAEAKTNLDELEKWKLE
tara:strand:- start:262 stop:666 length:405 start_codon:yes stop_codon:yes gene_type:complete